MCLRLAVFSLDRLPDSELRALRECGLRVCFDHRRWSGYLTRIMDTIFRFRLHPAYSSIAAPNPKMTLGAQCLFGTLKGGASKSLKVVFFSSVIGMIDGLQARYFTIGSFGNEIGILYQACYLMAAGAAAYFCLHNKAWSAKRNMLNLMVSIPV